MLVKRVYGFTFGCLMCQLNLVVNTCDLGEVVKPRFSWDTTRDLVMLGKIDGG